MINAGAHLFETLAGTDPGAKARPRLLLGSISVEANDANFRQLFCFLTAFESAMLPPCC